MNIDEEIPRLDMRITELAQIVRKEHEGMEIVRKLHEQWFDRLTTLQEGQEKRTQLTNIVAGYMWATLEDIHASGQISKTMEERVAAALNYVKPMMAEIMRLPSLSQSQRKH